MDSSSDRLALVAEALEQAAVFCLGLFGMLTVIEYLKALW